MTRHNVPANEDGFTYTELVVALVILAVSITGMIKILPGFIHSSRYMENASNVILLARSKSEEILSVLERNYNAPIASTGNFSADGYPSYLFEVTVGNFYRLSPKWIKGISVKVWFDEDTSGTVSGDEKPLELYLVFSNRGRPKGGLGPVVF